MRNNWEVVNERRLQDLFLDLCKVNSPSLKEKDCVAFVRQYLEGFGLRVWEDEAGAAIGGNANNLMALLPGNLSTAPKVFLSAHFDTVEPTEGLKILFDEDRICSDGTTILGADDKGGMAPAIEAVLSLAESREPHGDIYLLLSVAEEIGLKGAAALKIEELELDFGFVLDKGPPVGSFVNQTAFHDKLNVKFFGKPAHAGKDLENGLSAIQVAVTAINQMKLGRIDEQTTANFGLISGGSAVNVVPALVELKGEARSLSLESLELQTAHMIECLTNAAEKFGAQIEIDHARHYSAYHIDVDSKVAQIAFRASSELGSAPEFRKTLGGSDANIFNAKGVPTIVVATGMQRIHTHEEFITRSDLVATARVALIILVESSKQF